MSMLGPLTCSALTVIDPVFPPDELVCSLTMRLMPPGNEMARFGVDTRMDWPAAVKPTISALPVTEACVPLQVALEFDFTIGSNETTQQAQIRDRRLRLTGSATARAGTLQRVSRGQAQNIDAR